MCFVYAEESLDINRIYSIEYVTRLLKHTNGGYVLRDADHGLFACTNILGTLNLLDLAKRCGPPTTTPTARA